MMKTEKISLSLLELNAGQVEGVPGNPRTWTVRELEKLQRSIVETPELLEMRPPIVVKNRGRYVVLGGNMRVSAMKELARDSMECVVLPDDMPVQKLREIVIKDNAVLGSWDVEALASDWKGYDLEGFGIPDVGVPEGDGFAGGAGARMMPTDTRVVVEVEFPAAEFEFVNNKLRDYGDTPEEAVKNLLAV